jgi:hypothetical protein
VNTVEWALGFSKRRWTHDRWHWNLSTLVRRFFEYSTYTPIYFHFLTKQNSFQFTKQVFSPLHTAPFTVLSTLVHYLTFAKSVIFYAWILLTLWKVLKRIYYLTEVEMVRITGLLKLLKTSRFNPLKVSINYTYHCFNNQQLCILHRECICGFYMNLKTNSDCILKQPLTDWSL